jgi:hypothetical protein
MQGRRLARRPLILEATGNLKIKTGEICCFTPAIVGVPASNLYL